MWLFSVCIAFIVFGTIANILCNFVDIVFDLRKDMPIFYWGIISLASAAWVCVVPAIGVVFIIYLLKLLTDKVSQYIINKVNNRKDKKDV